MTLFDQIKAVYLEKRKARETAAVGSLSTLIGEIETLAKAGRGETTDVVVVTMVKKFIKNADETLKLMAEAGQHGPAMKVLEEKQLYESFLPKQLTTDQLDALIDKFIADGVTNVGDAMKRLKTEHGGTYDGAVASKILKARFV